MQAVRIAISGYYGFGNAGDEAILASMLQSLARRLPKVELWVFSDNPTHTRSQFGVHSVDRKNPIAIAKVLLRTSLMLSGGGGLIQDSTGINTIRYYLSVVRMARMLRVPVMFYAQGLGPIATDKGKAMTRQVANRVQLITVRDTESRDLFKSIGVTRPPLYVTADPVLALEPSRAERISEIWRQEDLPSNVVGLSIRPWPHGGDATKEAFVRVGRHLRDKHGAHVLLLPFQVSQDRSVCQDVAAAIGSGCQVLRGVYGPNDFMGLVGRLNAVVAMRLHALIFAAAQGVPMAGVAYDPKVSQFLRLVGGPAVSLETLQPETLVATADDLMEHRQEYAARFAATVPPLRERALDNVTMVESLLRGETVSYNKEDADTQARQTR